MPFAYVCSSGFQFVILGSAGEVPTCPDTEKIHSVYLRPAMHPKYFPEVCNIEKRKDFFMNIYVGNLSYKLTEDRLKVMFEEFGKVDSVKVLMDRFTGKSKGFGFVEMPSNSEADQAIKALNGKFVDDRNIKVNPADPGGKRSKRSVRKKRY